MSRPIRKILIANRGEIARRVIRTCRSLGIRSVAVYSPPDAGAPYVRRSRRGRAAAGRAAGGVVPRRRPAPDRGRRHRRRRRPPRLGLPGRERRLRHRLRRARASSSSGPSPEAITRMGSKIGARALMEAAGVPVVPGATLTSIDDDAAIVAAGESVGYPLLVKASAGGGGKGMRLVGSGAELAEAVGAQPREAASSFGDATVFLERYVDRAPPRRDPGGRRHPRQVAHLFERDCSVQRRHQKLIEEAPSPAVDEDLRAAHGRGRGDGRPVGRLPRCGHRRVPARARRRVLLPGDEHPPPGRASRDGDGHGPRPRRASSWPWPRAGPCPPRRSTPASRATPSKRACTPRTRWPTTGPHIGRIEHVPSRPGRGCASSPASRPAPRSAPTTTPCWPR